PLRHRGCLVATAASFKVVSVDLSMSRILRVVMLQSGMHMTAESPWHMVVPKGQLETADESHMTFTLALSVFVPPHSFRLILRVGVMVTTKNNSISGNTKLKEPIWWGIDLSVCV